MNPKQELDPDPDPDLVPVLDSINQQKITDLLSLFMDNLNELQNDVKLLSNIITKNMNKSKQNL